MHEFSQVLSVKVPQPKDKTLYDSTQGMVAFIQIWDIDQSQTDGFYLMTLESDSLAIKGVFYFDEATSISVYPPHKNNIAYSVYGSTYRLAWGGFFEMRPASVTNNVLRIFTAEVSSDGLTINLVHRVDVSANSRGGFTSVF